VRAWTTWGQSVLKGDRHFCEQCQSVDRPRLKWTQCVVVMKRNIWIQFVVCIEAHFSPQYYFNRFTYFDGYGTFG